MSWFSVRSFLILLITIVPMQLHAISYIDDEVIYLCNKHKTPLYSDNPIAKHHCRLLEKEEFLDGAFSRHPSATSSSIKKVSKTADMAQEDEALKQKNCEQAQNTLAAMQKLEAESSNRSKDHQLVNFYEKQVQQYCH